MDQGKVRKFQSSLKAGAVNEEIRQQVLRNWDSLALPLDGMGAFREITAQIGGILEDPDVEIGKKAVLVFCSDNGVVEEGVSQTGQDVTRIVAESMGMKKSSVCLMAQEIGAEVIPVDVGISSGQTLPGVLDRKIRAGSRNFRKEPAMTQEETLQALQSGMDLAGECRQRGCRLLGTGEMGIGNTTTSSAVAASLLGEDVRAVTGRGAGLSDAGYEKKCRVIEEALEKYDLRKQDVFTVLETVGGYDIAALAGLCIGGCVCGIPVVLDGVISMTAALAAVRILPKTREFLIASHASREPAAQRLGAELGLSPVIDGRMALGEGTGAMMMMSLLDLSVSVYHGMRTFEGSGIGPYRRYDSESGG